MKRYLTILIIALGFITNLDAQNDSFFTYGSAKTEDRSKSEWTITAELPTAHGLYGHQNAEVLPLGSGILLLAGLGLGYAAFGKRKQ